MNTRESVPRGADASDPNQTVHGQRGTGPEARPARSRSSNAASYTFPDLTLRRMLVGTQAFGARAVFGRRHVRPDRAGRALSAVPAVVHCSDDPRAQRRLGRRAHRVQLPEVPLRLPDPQPEAPPALAARAPGRGAVQALPRRLGADAAGQPRLPDRVRAVVRNRRRRLRHAGRAGRRDGFANDGRRLRQAGRADPDRACPSASDCQRGGADSIRGAVAAHHPQRGLP